MLFMREVFCWALNPRLGEGNVLYALKKLSHYIIKSKPVSCQFELLSLTNNTPSPLSRARQDWPKITQPGYYSLLLRTFSLHLPRALLGDTGTGPKFFLRLSLIFPYNSFLVVFPPSQKGMNSLPIQGISWEAVYRKKKGVKKRIMWHSLRGSELLTKSPEKLSLTSFLRWVTSFSPKVGESSLFQDPEVTA